jgi:hypothetical protein
MLENFGGKVPFIPQVQELASPLFEVNGPENKMIQDGTDPDPDKRETTHEDADSGIFSGKISGVLLQSMPQDSGVITA